MTTQNKPQTEPAVPLIEQQWNLSSSNSHYANVGLDGTKALEDMLNKYGLLNDWQRLMENIKTAVASDKSRRGWTNILVSPIRLVALGVVTEYYRGLDHDMFLPKAYARADEPAVLEGLKEILAKHLETKLATPPLFPDFFPCSVCGKMLDTWEWERPDAGIAARRTSKHPMEVFCRDCADKVQPKGYAMSLLDFCLEVVSGRPIRKTKWGDHGRERQKIKAIGKMLESGVIRNLGSITR